MKLSLQELKAVYPEQIWQELPETELKQRESTIRRYSNQTAQSNADLNRLCLNAFGVWVKENHGDSIKELPSQADLPYIWEVVNGTAVAIGKTRLVLIPDEATDTETFTVPQEWVDIPDWIADYYLAVQVDIDAGWISVWGFTSHRTLKHKAIYDPVYRTYSLERDFVIADLDMLWLAQEIGLEEKAKVEQLKPLAPPIAENLLIKLSEPSLYFPRLDVRFEEWGALLASQVYRKALYNMRQENASSKLWQFLKRNYALVQDGWQDIEAFLNTERAQIQLAYSLRNTSQLSNSSIPWQGKLIQLQKGLKEITLLLQVAFIKEADGRVGVRVQVHPGLEEIYLPPNLKLALLFDLEVLESENSGKSNLYIELPYFKCNLGTQFCIEIALENLIHVENFAIEGDIA